LTLNEKKPAPQDFIGIVLLLLVNATIGYVEESAAAKAVKVREFRVCEGLSSMVYDLCLKY
jgi:hypothetical protein